MALKLYGYFRSSAAFRVRIALNLKKLDYETAAIHLRRNDQTRPDYLAVNPQGLVPTLDDGGRTLIQSLAIIEYLDEAYADPALLPKDPAERARVRALAEIVACDIHPINNLRVLRYLMHSLGHDEAAIATWYNHWIDAGFQAFERLLVGDPGPARSATATCPVLPTSLWCLRWSMPSGTGSILLPIRRSLGSTRAAWRSTPLPPRIRTANPIARREPGLFCAEPTAAIAFGRRRPWSSERRSRSPRE
jgi:maleylacetoacetate isomerase